jgi:hypothetical protein
MVKSASLKAIPSLGRRSVIQGNTVNIGHIRATYLSEQVKLQHKLPVTFQIVFLFLFLVITNTKDVS